MSESVGSKRLVGLVVEVAEDGGAGEAGRRDGSGGGGDGWEDRGRRKEVEELTPSGKVECRLLMLELLPDLETLQRPLRPQ